MSKDHQMNYRSSELFWMVDTVENKIKVYERELLSEIERYKQRLKNLEQTYVLGNGRGRQECGRCGAMAAWRRLSLAEANREIETLRHSLAEAKREIETLRSSLAEAKHAKTNS